FTELFGNLGILGENQLESANLLGTASNVVLQRRAKTCGDKISMPDEDDTTSDRDCNFNEVKSMSTRKAESDQRTLPLNFDILE
ncbi:MAG: hypothetical protein P8O08_16050, partial [Paracoccaceae bacterium]|nr:hypothetical protein [Paracoccaceae bacterium]